MYVADELHSKVRYRGRCFEMKLTRRVAITYTYVLAWKHEFSDASRDVNFVHSLCGFNSSESRLTGGSVQGELEQVQSAAH